MQQIDISWGEGVQIKKNKIMPVEKWEIYEEQRTNLKVKTKNINTTKRFTSDNAAYYNILNNPIAVDGRQNYQGCFRKLTTLKEIRRNLICYPGFAFLSPSHFCTPRYNK